VNGVALTKIDLAKPKAQTIVDLLAQLRVQGYEPSELARVHRGYELTVRGGAGYFRSSGRTLADHCVGVAGIVAALALPGPMVAAAVAHAVYVHGDFGALLRRVDRRKRERVRRAVGDEAESVILGYTLIDRNVERIDAVRRRLDSLTASERELLRLRLADLLDIYGERDALYCHNVAKRRDVATRLGPEIVAVAARAGFTDLGEALARSFRDVANTYPPVELTNPPWRDGTILPSSYRKRPMVGGYQWTRTKVYRLIGR